MESKGLADDDFLVMNNVTLGDWLFDLSHLGVGRYSLNAAIGSWQYFNALLVNEKALFLYANF